MIDEAVAGFRGTYLQQPPDYSAKKIDGDRAYDLARKNAPIRLEPVQVTVSALDVIEWQANRLRLRLVCSAGYYVRSLADALGERLGTGAHLAPWCERAAAISPWITPWVWTCWIERPAEAASHVVPMAALLPALPAVTLTPDGASLAARGGFIGPPHVKNGPDVCQRPAKSGSSTRMGAWWPSREVREKRQRGSLQRVLHPGVVLE